jgi:peptidyl-dipeptidase A
MILNLCLGYRDAGDQERSQYGVKDLESQVAEVWASVSPLYRQLHAFVRARLRQHYIPHRISATAPIPAHILGTAVFR